MRRALLVAGATVENGGDGASGDANRFRRMDRFGRSGALAGERALAAGVDAVSTDAAPDACFGVVVGTAFGCRDAVTHHAELLASAARIEDLAPSVFAATVHNAVAGGLAIAHGLGGVAETLVSGRTAGLEALAWAAARVARGDADRILVVAAEGIDAALRAAWERENPGRTLVESAAAVLVEGREEEENLLRKKGTAIFEAASLSFGDDGLSGTSEENRFLEGVSGGGARRSGEAAMERRCDEGVERLGASGLWEIATDVAAAAAASDAQPRHRADGNSPSKKIHRYFVRDVHGSCAAVTLAFFS